MCVGLILIVPQVCVWGGYHILLLTLGGRWGGCAVPGCPLPFPRPPPVTSLPAPPPPLQGVTSLFGHTKNEMEGNNITMLMPQPFCQRHASYLQRYTSTMSPHILDSLREVVALHKVGG